MEEVPLIEELRKLSQEGADQKSRERQIADAKAVSEFKVKFAEASRHAAASGLFTCRIQWPHYMRSDAIIKAMILLGYKITYEQPDLGRNGYTVSWGK